MGRVRGEIFHIIPAENDYGFIEYKWRLLNVNNYRLNKLTSQMKWRVVQSSNFSALYIIGVHDKGEITGITKREFVETYVNLLDCARMAGLYTCLKIFRKIRKDVYWGVLQVFKSSDENRMHCDMGIPRVPRDNIPTYLLF